MVYAHTSQDGPQNCPNCGSKKWVHSGVCDECVDCSRQICSECCACNVEGILTCSRCVDDLLEEQPNEDPDCTCAGADDEPAEIDDSVKFCPECEKPNQFGELCWQCLADGLPNEDPDCICVYTDVDRVDPSGCPEHGRRAM